MKTFSRWLIFPLLAAAPALAVVLPLRIPFQGKLIDPATNNPRNGTYSIQFKLYSAPTGGLALFTETQSVAVTNGVFSVQVGTISLLSPDLFSGASAYLGVTVGADAEMLPRQPLSMSPYAFTAAQLVSDRNIRINSENAYSTFTTAGNWVFPYGVTGGTATFMTVASTNIGTFGITTSSGISMGAGTLKIDADSRGIDATGTGIVATTAAFANIASTGIGTFGITTSSGISMGDGTLKIEANSSGIDATGTGITLSTVDFTGATTDPVGADGMVYYNTSSETLKQYSTANGWQWLYPQGSLSVAWGPAVSTTGPTAAKAAASTLLLTPVTLSGPMQVNSMILRVNTALGAAGDIGVYNSTGGLVLQGGAGSVTTAVGLKAVAPIQTAPNRWLPPGQYFVGATWSSTTGIIAGQNFVIAGLVPRCGTLATGGATVPQSIAIGSITNVVYCYFFVLAN